MTPRFLAAAPRARRRGLTIVELMVAVIVLSIGLLSLAGTSTYVVRQMTGGSQQTVAAHIAQSRFDSIASVRCADLPTAASTRYTATTRGISEVWRVNDGHNVKDVIDTIRIRGRKRPLVYRTTITCRD